MGESFLCLLLGNRKAILWIWALASSDGLTPHLAYGNLGERYGVFAVNQGGPSGSADTQKDAADLPFDLPLPSRTSAGRPAN